jgi:hypothetical protein
MLISLGLPVVDGVTITHDLLSAVAIGLVDVPIIIQTMQCELDSLDPDKTIYDYSPSQYQAFLESYFASHGWNASAGSLIYSLYEEQVKISTELGYQQWYTEFSFYCGNSQVLTQTN